MKYRITEVKPVVAEYEDIPIEDFDFSDCVGMQLFSDKAFRIRAEYHEDMNSMVIHLFIYDLFGNQKSIVYMKLGEALIGHEWWFDSEDKVVTAVFTHNEVTELFTRIQTCMVEADNLL